MISLFKRTGKIALGSRLRMLSATLTQEAARVYKLYDVDLSPKWFPVFFVLSEQPELTITEIAQEIGHSQPSVSKIIREMTAQGLITDNIKSADKRRNVVALSEKGLSLVTKIQDQYTDLDKAIEEMMAQARHNLWEALEEWEFLFEQKSLYRRVQEQKKARESAHVHIIPYSPAYKEVFRQLNEEWISAYFEMEEADYKALNDPENYIINKGGHILVALYKDDPVGVCALVKMDDPEYDYELAKMAVSPLAQGKSIGYLLGTAAIEKARSAGASQIYLESNTILKPAISLYHKLGFQKIAGHPTPYKRCNIQMVLNLKETPLGP